MQNRTGFMPVFPTMRASWSINDEMEDYEMLVSATEMLKKAKAGHYAVGQFNINNLEWTKSILATAQELNSRLFWVCLRAPASI